MAERRFVRVTLRVSGETLIERALWCASFACRLRGLMFRARLGRSEALILVEEGPIHMFFVPFPICAVWVDGSGRVVHKVIARPWRPYYAARDPARYILETTPEFFDRVSLGDELDFEDQPDPAGR